METGGEEIVEKTEDRDRDRWVGVWGVGSSEVSGAEERERERGGEGGREGGRKR